MYTVLIVEDDIVIQGKIKELLLCLKKEINVLTSSKGKVALKLALGLNIDLFIIDIMLPDGNGFELAEKLRLIYQDTPIILESASDDYKALATLHDHFENIDYIAKPFSPEKLIRKIKSAFTTIEKREKCLILKQRTTYNSIPINDIIYIESVNNRHNIRIISYDCDERKLHVDEFYGVALKEILVRAGNPKELCRCHKSFIVNIYKIKKIDASNKLIYLKHDDQDIPIGDTYKKNLEKEFRDGLDF